MVFMFVKITNGKKCQQYLIMILLFFHGQEQKSSGIHGGSFISDTWTTRDINTIVFNNINGADLENNNITLPPGNYYIHAAAHAHAVNGHKLRIYSNEKLMTGFSSHANARAGGSSTETSLFGYFLFEEETTMTLQHICEETKETNGLGKANNFGTEIYNVSAKKTR